MAETSVEGLKFGKVPWSKLQEDGYTAVDMHFHTNHSDSPTTIRSLLRYAKKVGTGVAITDHNQVSGVVEAMKAQSGVFIIPGTEISAADGPHILLYFYDLGALVEYYERHIRPYKRKSPYLAIRLNSQEIVDRASGYDCIRVAAHPYGYLLFNKGLQKCIDAEYLEQEILDSFEGVEVINGGMTHALNIKAGELAERFGKGRTAGTDGHLLGDLGNVVCVGPSDNVEDFLGDVVERRTIAMGREKNVLEKTATGTVLMTKYIRYTGPSMRIHYEQNMPRVMRACRRLVGREQKRVRKK